MLKGVAVQVLSQGWAFRYDTDERFVAEQPRIVERQAELLKLKHQSVTSTTPAHTRRISASQTHAAASSGPDHHALLKAHFEKEGVVTLTAVRQFCMCAVTSSCARIFKQDFLCTQAMYLRLCHGASS